MEGKLVKVSSKHTSLEKNVGNVTEACKVLVSAACKQYGIKLNFPLPTENDLLSDLVKSLANDLPTSLPPTVNAVIELSLNLMMTLHPLPMAVAQSMILVLCN